MMNATVFSFTRNGALISVKLQQYLESFGFTTKILTTKRYAELDPALQEIAPGLQETCKDAFATDRLLVFLGATGIAIRAIAPYIRSKTKDPAVISIDERGKFVIPLLSGHIGGANELAEELAQGLGALAVITTATDLNGLFAADQWARENSMRICDMGLAKQMSADLLEGKTIGYFTSFPIQGTPPKELAEGPGSGTELEISIAASPRSRKALQLIPRCVVLGIGCRKGTSAEAIEI